jgi:PTH1 family peptidyl-tRNA hydrolase
MKLIVGLGNPGKEYVKTRHNIGFMAIDKYIENKNLNSKEKFGGIYYETNINGEKAILLKPQKYINLSGEVIIQFVKFFKINIDDVLIIHDDLDMPVGKTKLRMSGGSGGHNGLKNIELYFKTQLANGSNTVILYDQIENDVDKEFIATTIVESIRKAKKKAQVIIVTHLVLVAY